MLSNIEINVLTRVLNYFYDRRTTFQILFLLICNFMVFSPADSTAEHAKATKHHTKHILLYINKKYKPHTVTARFNKLINIRRFIYCLRID